MNRPHRVPAPILRLLLLLALVAAIAVAAGGFSWGETDGFSWDDPGAVAATQ
jgi:hypothetical protein